MAGFDWTKKGMSMIPLPTQFRFDQFDFRQLARKGDVALFRKTKWLPNAKIPFLSTTYEVVIVRRMPDHQWPDGRFAPAHEHMPSGEQWGTYGWSLQTKERAWEKFNEEIQHAKWLK